jgi:hypothetical protein
VGNTGNRPRPRPTSQNSPPPAANSRARSPIANSRTGSPAGDDSLESSSDEIEVQPKKRRARRSRVQTAPRNMNFYTGAWFDILRDAKNLYRLHVHRDDPFPVRASGTLLNVHDNILEAHQTYVLVNGPIDSCLFNYATSVCTNAHDFD